MLDLFGISQGVRKGGTVSPFGENEDEILASDPRALGPATDGAEITASAIDQGRRIPFAAAGTGWELKFAAKGGLIGTDKSKTMGGIIPEIGIPDGATSGSCLLYTSPSPRDQRGSRMPSSA